MVLAWSMGSLKNQILISMPHMNDPFFSKSVVYICEHGNGGAMGMIINKSLDDPGHKDSLLIKLGTAKKQNANFDVIYDPTNNNKTEISYLKDFNYFKLKLKSNYNLFSKIPDYGANIEFSGTF